MEEEHVPLLIVQVKVALVPAVIPVTPEVAEAGVVIVAVPLVTVHKPLPVLGVFPAKANAAVLHWLIADPATEVVGVASTVIELVVADAEHPLLLVAVNVNVPPVVPTITLGL